MVTADQLLVRLIAQAIIWDGGRLLSQPARGWPWGNCSVNVVSTTVLGLIFGLVYNRSRNLLHVSFLHWWVWVSNIGAQVLFHWLWY